MFQNKGTRSGKFSNKMLVLVANLIGKVCELSLDVMHTINTKIIIVVQSTYKPNDVIINGRSTTV